MHLKRMWEEGMAASTGLPGNECDKEEAVDSIGVGCRSSIEGIDEDKREESLLSELTLLSLLYSG
jgi:hypothetical protein